MKHGEVWWANLPKPVGKRPVLILSRDRAIQVRGYITIAQITRTIRNIPTEVLLGPAEGLPKKCVVNLDVINTIPKDLLSESLTTLSAEKISDVEAALKFALDLR